MHEQKNTQMDHHSRVYFQIMCENIVLTNGPSIYLHKRSKPLSKFWRIFLVEKACQLHSIHSISSSPWNSLNAWRSVGGNFSYHVKAEQFFYLTSKTQGTPVTLLVTELQLLTHKLSVPIAPEHSGVTVQNFLKFKFHTLTIFASINHMTKHLK